VATRWAVIADSDLGASASRWNFLDLEVGGSLLRRSCAGAPGNLEIESIDPVKDIALLDILVGDYPHLINGRDSPWQGR